jgi:hypothetical protein
LDRESNPDLWICSQELALDHGGWLDDNDDDDNNNKFEDKEKS